jgi:DNA processing protein
LKALHSSRDVLLSIGVSEKVADKFCVWRNGIQPEALARRCDAEGIRFVLAEDPEFPPLLTQSSDPPAALFVRGAPIRVTRPIAIVGTRSMTPYGAKVTDRICRDLAVAGCEIVSGLALGIDAQAHAAALDVGGKTVAVLGGGCNDGSIYPRNNAPLAARILESGGTILTEFPPGTESMKHHFPLRNRIIASISLATVVIEAAESSGSLITASLAIEENRDVFAVPGPVTSEQSTGTNRLLKMGAIPCTGADDVLRLFEFRPTETETCGIEATDDERSVLEILDRTMHVDELIREIGKPASAVTSTLMSLELKGLIEAEVGNLYSRTKAGRRAAKPHPTTVSDDQPPS